MVSVSKNGGGIPVRYSIEASLQFRHLMRRWLEGRYAWERTAKGGKHADEGHANISRAVRDLTGGDDHSLGRKLRRLCYEENDEGQLSRRRVTDETVDHLTTLFAKKDREFPGEVSKALWSDPTRELRRAMTDQDFDWAANASPVELGAMLREPDQPWPLTWGRNLPEIRKEPDAWNVLEEFRSWAEETGHHKLLVEESLKRILGPLAAHSRTGGLMPGWNDLPPGAQLRFIKSGVVREELMLGRKPVHVRAANRWSVGFTPKEIERTISETAAQKRQREENFRAYQLYSGEVEYMPEEAQPDGDVERTPVPPPSPLSTTGEPTRASLAPEHGGVELVEVPAGTFLMGSPDSEEGRFGDESPQHAVDVPMFFLGRYPVTNEEYARFLAAHPNAVEPLEWGNPRFNQARQPVVGLSSYEARLFCQWAGGRLPSEAEWEYAARAATTTRFYHGDDKERFEEHAWSFENSGDVTHPVGEKPPNAFGLHDMLGNVWEWCEDAWHGDYKRAPTDGSVWEGGDDALRVARGGSFGDVRGDLRCALRLGGQPDVRARYAGFRLVVSPSVSDL